MARQQVYLHREDKGKKVEVRIAKDFNECDFGFTPWRASKSSAYETEVEVRLNGGRLFPAK